ncbi:hypothetical protein B296_00013275 [Ensete ventricosum]|uniref:Uncharacterized protein n=1 Tax=Ensete ventricosum TaxID=4639 RepID=A0A427ALT1_ENSVE|nr:hypothetical protein B296_00013275 [Ensete ventricosum]
MNESHPTRKKHLSSPYGSERCYQGGGGGQQRGFGRTKPHAKLSFPSQDWYELVRIESSLELVGTKSSLELVGIESMLELVEHYCTGSGLVEYNCSSSGLVEHYYSGSGLASITARVLD